MSSAFRHLSPTKGRLDWPVKTLSRRPIGEELSRSPDIISRRDSRGGGSSSRSTSSAGQKSRRVNRYAAADSEKDMADTDVENDFQVQRSLQNGTSGPDTFKILIRLVSAHFDHGDRSASIAKLHSFGVATKRPSADYFWAFRLLIASVTDSEQVFAPSVELLLEVVRHSVSEQYPGLIPVLYQGELATASKPFGSIDEMWLAFGGLSTSKTPAINGDKHFTLPPLAGLSLHSHASGRTQGRPAPP